MEIVIYIYNGLTALDAVGPYEVLSRLPNAKVKFVAKEKGVIVTDTHFLKLVAEYEISEINRADILLIPGSTVGFLKEIKNKNLISWIQKIHETTTWTTSVCSGSIILAASGILKNLTSTSHWAVSHLLKDYGAIPLSERFIQNGKIITAAGVSAGIDMSLFLVGQILGEEKAKGYQLVLEYDPQPPFDAGNFQKADERSIQIARKIMEHDAKKDLTLFEMVKHAQSLIKLKKNKQTT
jgi:transcriptional regulator GlxA family with amidase domain